MATEFIVKAKDRPGQLAAAAQALADAKVNLWGTGASTSGGAGTIGFVVKDKDADHLTLSIGGAASGDYPVEVYALGAASAPQARQRLVFRVAAGPTLASAAGAPGALFNTAQAPAQAQPAAAAPASPLMARAMRLLGEGDIAGARLLLMHLAEQGEADAAYELARTFDAEYLTELGARGVGPDKTRAVGWYEWASESGSVKAAERLKILASLSD